MTRRGSSAWRWVRRCLSGVAGLVACLALAGVGFANPPKELVLSPDMSWRPASTPAAVGAGVAVAPPAQPTVPVAKKYNVGYTVAAFLMQPAIGRTDTQITVAVWFPTTTPPQRYHYGGPTHGQVAVDGVPCRNEGPFPLFVFSHGFGGSGNSISYLAEALAARGWVVAAPDHHDAVSAARVRQWELRPFDRAAFRREANEIQNSGPESRAVHVWRVGELQTVIDGMLGAEQFRALCDPRRVAVGGHSFGGFTALGLCGALPGQLDRRIRALLLLSTGAGGYLFRREELQDVAVPTMIMLGERERETRRGTTSMEELAIKVFTSIRAEKYLLVLAGANHFAFNTCLTDGRLASWFLAGSPEQFALINAYAIAFLDRHVSGAGDPRNVLGKQDPGVTSYLREDGRAGGR